MVAAFDPSLDATVDAIRKHVAGNRTTHVFLVGGFAASPWVFSETKRRLKAAGLGCEVKRAQSDTAKAVAHGGVVFYLDRNVTERTMRFTCGIGISPSYNSSNAEHEARKHKLWKDEIEGRMYVGGGFSTLVKKDQVVSVDSVYRQSGIHSKATRAPETITWYQSIQRYSGTRSSINFIDMDASGVRYLLRQ
ncbi:hypothetical protein FRB90_004633 [Tulasnella sp. 427]|nr:hypothetical protein FRB90_004633 [Tulasnella sp. 427]